MSGARIWERGRLGGPGRGAAWARCGVVVAATAIGVGACWVQWAHASWTGTWAILDLVPGVLVASAAMTAVLYWLHGSAGQVMLFLAAALTAVFVGGVTLGDAVLAGRGTVARATVTDAEGRTDIRGTSWTDCRLRLPDGTPLALPVRCDRERPGDTVTVTTDPGGLVPPALGDRTHVGPALPGLTGACVVVAVGCAVAATWKGERQRLRGEPSLAERYNPGYYPRRRSSPGYGSRPRRTPADLVHGA
ncbi:membrane protein of unknown function [Streptantibioticus cattleyicolor NRRL 8057 = DSM 46488]|nr:membrane protein of unknown function [Streptantibioticus cattleyicolor NRRL 8057 = DSM 46488]